MRRYFWKHEKVSKLKPCPFCKGKRTCIVEHRIANTWPPKYDGFRIYHNDINEKCPLHGFHSQVYKERIDAVMAWNRRDEK